MSQNVSARTVCSVSGGNQWSVIGNQGRSFSVASIGRVYEPLNRAKVVWQANKDGSKPSNLPAMHGYVKRLVLTILVAGTLTGAQAQLVTPEALGGAFWGTLIGGLA